MPRPLVIVESPTKARTIAGFLGDDVTVKSSVGHIRDLPDRKEQVPPDKVDTHGRLAGIDPDQNFDVVYVVPPGKKKLITELRQAMKGVDEVYLATDEDREGEAIAWHLLEVLSPKVPVKRMVFHEITPQAIRDAIDHPRDIDLKLVEAQECRRILDRLLGWELSPVLWRRVGKSARSAGRVQSVAVRLVVERERARMAFRSGSWFDLEGVFSAHDAEFGAQLIELDARRLATGNDFDPATGAIRAGLDVVRLDEPGATALAERLLHSDFRVRSVEAKPFTRRPSAPFTTSTLQQEASRKLGFPASKTMAVAQRLYERGFITYMRTDSTNLSDQAVHAARASIRERYGEQYLPPQPRSYKNKVKNAQEAHEAVRPAGERIRTPDEVSGSLDRDEARLYELIWVRTIACQMVDARGHTTTLLLGATAAPADGAGTAAPSANQDAVFRASGVTWDFLGFRRAYVEGRDEDNDDEREANLPPVSEGDQVACSVLAPAGHSTRPPARFTDATLVKELEQRGIGRPSTYASVIQTILDRGYVWRRGQALIPTWTAFAVTNLLERHFGHLVDYGFTATMEEALDVIARGEGEAERWLQEFYFGNGDSGLRDLVGDDNLATIDGREIGTVPLGPDDDGVPIVVRVGRYGPYVQRGGDDANETAGLPDGLAPDELTIPVALELIAKKAAGPKSLGSDPDSGKDVLVLEGPYGPYVQLGEQEEGSKRKPKRASLFKSMDPDSVTLDDALRLLTLPRVVGVDAEGREIVASPGRFGPYLKRADGDTRSLDSEDQLLTIDVAGAESRFAQPKQRGRRTRAPLAELGASPDGGAPVRVMEGRFGAYVTDGTTNASVTRGTDPTTLTLDDAVALLRARREAEADGSARPSKRTAKKATKATAKKATAKKAAKKAVAKKPAAAKKPTKKST
jgi:DNA topoisomerase-1